MKFAVIGDIHSNKFALESVLQDIDTRKVDFIISTGDLVGYLPFPNEVIDIIRENKIITVRGNHDERIADSDIITDDIINKMSEEEIHKKASMAFTNWVITEENRGYIKNLPEQVKLKFSGLSVLIVHGSPRAINEYLYEDSDKLEEISKVLDEDIVISGHTHIPYHVKINDKHFINAGSVGKPKDGTPHATYTIIDIDDKKVNSEMIKVSYDIKSIIEAIEGNRMISNKLVQMLREGY